jgi:hypothetical protein
LLVSEVLRAMVSAVSEKGDGRRDEQLPLPKVVYVSEN